MRNAFIFSFYSRYEKGQIIIKSDTADQSQVKPMHDIFLPGLPVHDIVYRYLVDNFGCEPKVVNGRWSIARSDPMFTSKITNIVQTHEKIDLSQSDAFYIRHVLFNDLKGDFEDPALLKNVSEQIKIAGGLGILSEVDRHLHEILFRPWHSMIDYFISELVPFMNEKFQLNNVVPLSLRCSQQQKYFSLAKFAMVAQRQGLDQIDIAVFEKKVLHGIEMAGALKILSFVDALTRLIPFYLSLPIHRLGCVWHFYGPNIGLFPRILYTKGLFQEFYEAINPRSEGTNLSGCRAFKSVCEGQVGSHINFAASGVNRLMNYLNDFRNFVNERSEVDWLKQIQAFGAVHMLFADLLAINETMEPHTQFVLAFGAIDKIANLKKYIGHDPKSEEDIFESLISLKKGKYLISLIRDKQNANVSDFYKRLVTESYCGLHRELCRHLPFNLRNQRNRHARVRAFRNLHHGAFLRRGQFEDLFLQGRGVIPETLRVIPLILVMALVANPGDFLSHDNI